jgi:hypothetical protein
MKFIPMCTTGQITDPGDLALQTDVINSHLGVNGWGIVKVSDLKIDNRVTSVGDEDLLRETLAATFKTTYGEGAEVKDVHVVISFVNYPDANSMSRTGTFTACVTGQMYMGALRREYERMFGPGKYRVLNHVVGELVDHFYQERGRGPIQKLEFEDEPKLMSPELVDYAHSVQTKPWTDSTKTVN